MPSQPEPSHYFSPTPGATSARRRITRTLPEGRLLEFGTDRGVFSGDRVDPGTRFLLASVELPEGARTVVDVGCGYGPIAVTMALRSEQGTIVWAVDVNERARTLCAENAELNGVGDRVRVVAPEDVPTDLTVDAIWSNPPIRIGKNALHALLEEWIGRLSPDGVASLVVNKNLGADSLARWMAGRGWTVDRSRSRVGYRVLSVTNGGVHR